MSIFALRDVDAPQISRAAPICIIGAGIAGLVATMRLAQAGRRVIVLESGADTFNAYINELNHVEDAFGYYGRAQSGRFREFGGNSAYWGGRLISLSPSDTEERAYLSLPGWPFSITEIEIYKPEVERIFGIEDFPHEKDLLKKFDRTGVFPHQDADLKCRWFKCPTFRRSNIAATLKHELGRHNNIEVWLGATVQDFRTDRSAGRLTAVVARDLSGRTLTVKADEFVFAAGSIETTRLLLLLDVSTDKQAFRSCNVLGRYFQDHARVVAGKINPIDALTTSRVFGYRFIGAVRCNFQLEVTPEVQEAEAMASAHVEISLDQNPNSPLTIIRKFLREIQKSHKLPAFRDILKLEQHTSYLMGAAYWRLIHRQVPLPPDTDLSLEVSIEQLPDWQNRIILSKEHDRLGVPMARLEWKLTDSDEHTFKSALKCVSRYWRRSGLDLICPIEWAAYIHNDQVRLSDSADQRAHPSGSTRMGRDPTTSVVDPNLRCHHIPNVWLASASTFPSSGSANPTLTILQLTCRAIDALLRKK